MILRYLLDTSIVSSPMSKQPDARLVALIRAHDHECAIAAPVWHELIYGCRRLPRGKRRDTLETYLQEAVLASFPVLTYDRQAAEWHAHERARLERVGRPASFVDGQIAAIASVHDLVLVTVNVEDFAMYKGLAVENWGPHES